MTIASDFYELLQTFGDGATAPGTWGRKLHNRIAELEETHATLRSGFEASMEDLGLLSAKHADLQREHAIVKADHRYEVDRRRRREDETVSLDDIKREFEG